MKRRDFAIGAPFVIAAATLGSGSAVAQPKMIRMVESGGKSGESIEVAYIKPFTAKTGVRVSREAPNPLGKLRAMVGSGNISAALFELGSPSLAQAKALGLLDKLDWTAIDPLPIFPEARDDYGMGFQYFSTVMAWRADAKAPATWADFFDVERFPGKRALPDYPHYLLQFALIGDGVPADKVFPLDVDRAFRKLESVKKSVSVWWKAGTQPPQLLKDNEVRYAISWSTRIADEPTLRFTYDQGMYDISWLTVPKGVEPAEKALAMKLLHEVTVPESQVRATEIIKLSGNSVDLERLVGAEKFATFPTATKNKASQFRQDAEWWRINGEAVNKRWETFKLAL